MKKKMMVILSCMIVAAGGVLIASRYIGQESAPVNTQPTEVAVMAQTPEVGDIARTAEFIGTVEPDQQVQVFPKVSGTVLATHFEVGQPVKKGELLYEIDPSDIQLQLQAASAKTDATRIQLEQSLGSGYDAQVIAAKSRLDAAQTQYNSARSALKNYNDNFDDSLVQLDKQISKIEAQIKAYIPPLTPEQEVELAKLEQTLSMLKANYRDAEDDTDPQLRSLRTAYQNAQINYNAAKESYDLVAGVSREDAQTSVDANLKAAELGLQAQAKQLEYTKVYAPIDGIIEMKNVSAHDLSAPNAPAYVVSNKSVMTVNFSVSETVVSALEVGDVIQIENGGKTANGTIVEIPTMVDQKSGLFNVKASVDSEEIPLHTGSVVKIYASTEKAKDSILIPIDSVYYDEQTPYLYVLKDGVAVKTIIETGVADQDKIQVVSGITPDSEVITTWHPKLIDGVNVVRKQTQPEAAAAPATEE